MIFLDNKMAASERRPFIWTLALYTATPNRTNSKSVAGNHEVGSLCFNLNLKMTVLWIRTRNLLSTSTVLS